jgi:transposase-like protein
LDEGVPSGDDGAVAWAHHREWAGWLMRRRPSRASGSRSGFAGFRFPPDVIMIAVRWYLRYALSYRDVEELLAERGIQVDHVTIFR